MKTKLFFLLLLAGSSLFARSRFSVYVGAGPAYWGPPPVVVYSAPPPPVYYAPPVYARPGHVWINGYWAPSGPRWVWHNGYWGRRPHSRAYWVSPRYHGGRWYRGYWR
jgi:hypothetical protein